MQQGYGQLANLYMLDERQYRSPQACPPAGRRGSNRVADCAELLLAERTKLGARQEAWLDARLAASKARWNLLAQGTVMADIDERLAENPSVKFATGEYRGYLRLDITPDRLRAEMIGLDAPRDPQSARRTVASFAVDAGRPGVRRDD